MDARLSQPTAALMAWTSSPLLWATLALSLSAVFLREYRYLQNSPGGALLIAALVLLTFLVKFLIVTFLAPAPDGLPTTPFARPGLLLIALLAYEVIGSAIPSLGATRPWWTAGKNLLLFALLVIAIRLLVDRVGAALDLRPRGWGVTAALSLICLADIALKGAGKWYGGDWLYDAGITVHFLVIGLTEEAVFRRYLTGALIALTGRPIAAILLGGVLFGLAHVSLFAPPERIAEAAVTYLGETTLDGIIWGWIYYRTRSILPGIITHTLSNLF